MGTYIVLSCLYCFVLGEMYFLLQRVHREIRGVPLFVGATTLDATSIRNKNKILRSKTDLHFQQVIANVQWRVV